MILLRNSLTLLGGFLFWGQQKGVVSIVTICALCFRNAVPTRPTSYGPLCSICDFCHNCKQRCDDLRLHRGYSLTGDSHSDGHLLCPRCFDDQTFNRRVGRLYLRR